MTPTTAYPRARCFRRVGYVVGIVLVVAILVRLGFLRGVVAPVRIAGDSMAGGLQGERMRIDCQQCRRPYCFHTTSSLRDDQAVCPNCGARTSTAAALNQRGQRVLLDRWPLRFRPPRRWEVVAFRTPGREQHLSVKRVLGLPGEHVGFQRGDLAIDGQIVRKSIDQLRRLAIPVHDDRYHPPGSAGLPGRWQNESSGGGWRRVHGCWALTQSGRGPDASDPAMTHVKPPTGPGIASNWLVYHHWSCWPGPSPRAAEHVVMDNYGYNQQLSRSLHPVADLMLACRLQSPWQHGRLAFRIHDGRQWFQVVLTPNEGLGRLIQGGRPVAQFALPYAGYAREVLFEVALCDQQVLLAIDRTQVLAYAYEREAGAEVAISQPLGVNVWGMDARILELRVMRDIHYLAPTGLSGTWAPSRALSQNEYFVVGDNVPVSEDSRHWPGLGVQHNSLLGKVLRPIP